MAKGGDYGALPTAAATLSPLGIHCVVLAVDERLYLASQDGSDSNLLIVLYVQIMPDDLVMQLHR
ncbi:hypothetical protein, partial [Escherichia coli]|uniref:hypothetical protein n=1 Tax=Escherichia coli TaxID=562 RepID=UPI002020D96C